MDNVKENEFGAKKFKLKLLWILPTGSRVNIQFEKSKQVSGKSKNKKIHFI